MSLTLNWFSNEGNQGINYCVKHSFPALEILWQEFLLSFVPRCRLHVCPFLRRSEMDVWIPVVSQQGEDVTVNLLVLLSSCPGFPFQSASHFKTAPDRQVHWFHVDSFLYKSVVAIPSFFFSLDSFPFMWRKRGRKMEGMGGIFRDENWCRDPKMMMNIFQETNQWIIIKSFWKEGKTDRNNTNWMRNELRLAFVLASFLTVSLPFSSWEMLLILCEKERRWLLNILLSKLMMERARKKIKIIATFHFAFKAGKVGMKQHLHNRSDLSDPPSLYPVFCLFILSSPSENQILETLRCFLQMFSRSWDTYFPTVS